MLADIWGIRCEQNQQSWEVAEAIFGGCSGKSLLVKEVKTLEVQKGLIPMVGKPAISFLCCCLMGMVEGWHQNLMDVSKLQKWVDRYWEVSMGLKMWDFMVDCDWWVL